MNSKSAMVSDSKASGLEKEIDSHFRLQCQDRDNLLRRRLEFERDGYTKFKVDEFIPCNIYDNIREEVNKLVNNEGIRRDMHLATTDYSPRYMTTVPQKEIEAGGEVIRTVYNSDAVREYLGEICGGEVVSCKKEEEYIIARLEKSGDTHGWHWGDYPYTLIWIVEAPGIECGGILQCIPHTRWDKNNPQINWYIANNKIDNYFHLPGEIYFLRSDTTLHRVTPLEKDDQIRIILNTCWADAKDTRDEFEHETLDAAFL